MSCACGHHHDHHAAPIITGGKPVELPRPLIHVSGQLICQDMGQMLLAMELLPEHVALSRAEPGCVRFDLRQEDDPLVWQLDELFANEDAFTAHQARNAASRWGKESAGIARDLHRESVVPRIRPEVKQDRAGIAALLTAAFGGQDEAKLVDLLREDGDLALSLVADAAGTVVGHVALSPLKAEGPALALAPVAVHPALHGLGIGAALVRAALEAIPDHTIVVLGDPSYYNRFGFAPADLASPYAGPHLMALGPGLAAGSHIAHAKAFAAL